MKTLPVILLLCTVTFTSFAQRPSLTAENISKAISDASTALSQDPMRPGFHLTPPVGCMGDPNGGIFYKGEYHIFYGQHPFAGSPGGWYWAHAKSKDLLYWEHTAPTLTPAFELGLNSVGSGSTILNENNEPLAFFSVGKGGSMKFWRATFNDDLTKWTFGGKNPILTLDHPGIPDFHSFWRDPFVFETQGRTFLIACADLFDENYVPVPIFEATNSDLTEWDYKGILFSYPKHKLRNLEVPEFRPLGDKWVLMASADAPVDRVYYFLGDFDLDNLQFNMESEGILDYSGHYYAQETILDDQGDLYVMGWIPGWERPWLPYMRDFDLKNTPGLWNGCFAIPRKLTLEDGRLIQQPVSIMQQLRTDRITVAPRELRSFDATTATDVLEEIRGNQLEINVELDLKAASFVGLNVLCDDKGEGGMFIAWSGDLLNVDGVMVPMNDWKPGELIQLQIFIDKKFVEVFVNGGKYTASRQVKEEYITGDRIALTRLGGHAALKSMEAWALKTIN